MPTSTSTKASSFIHLERPSHNFLEVQAFLGSKAYSKRKAIPKHFSQYQRCYVYVHRGHDLAAPEVETEIVDSVQKAALLYSIPACKALLNGFLISEEAHAVVSGLIGESTDVVTAYSHLYFDTSVFFNDLLKVAYIRSLRADTEEEVFEKQVLSWGHYLGAKYIAWKIGSKTSSDILPSQAVKKVLDDSIWRSSEHALEDITSKKARESRAWVPQVLKSAELLNNIETTSGMENALSELKIKLKSDAGAGPDIDSMEIKG